VKRPEKKEVIIERTGCYDDDYNARKEIGYNQSCDKIAKETGIKGETKMDKKRIFVLGARGMAGSTIYDYLNSLKKYNITGTTRKQYDILNPLHLCKLKSRIKKYDVIINCIGLLIDACFLIG